MHTFLGNYKGVSLYEVEEFNREDGQQIQSKIIAQALIPGQENMKVDLTETATSRQGALKKMEQEIDRLREARGITSFIPIEQDA